MMIKKGTILSRGESGRRTPSINRKFAYYLFGDNAENIAAAAYLKTPTSTFKIFTTSKDLNLVKMDDISNILRLLKMAENSPGVITALLKSFRIPDKGNRVIRSSKPHHDDVVANFLCSRGFDGYYADTMEKKGGGKKFHQEILLCNPKSVLNKPKSSTPNSARKARVNTRSPQTPTLLKLQINNV